MGRTLEDKKEIVAELKDTIKDAQLAIVIDYSGLTVAEITNLRQQLRTSGSVCKVTKNTLMKIAIDGQDNWQPLEKLLKGSNAVLFVKEDIGSAIKAYQAFQKASKKTEVRGGVMEGRLLSENDVKALGDLPSKEQLIAQIAGAINGVATKLAVGIKEVPASVARGLQAYVDKDGKSDSEAA